MEKKEKRSTDKEIDLIPILKAIWAKLWLMLLVGVIVSVVVYGATKLFIKPTYRSGFTAYVNNQHAQSDKSGLSNQDLIAAQQLTKTYSHIICSNSVLTASLNSIDSDLTYAEFSKMVSTSAKDETELISVYVVNTDPQLACDLANAIAKTAPKYMSDIVEGSSMKIVDYPRVPQSNYGPSYLKFAIFGFLFGFLAVLVFVLVRFFLDDSVSDEGELETRFSLPVLGIIPDIESSSKSKSSSYYSSYGYGSTQISTEGKDQA